MSTEDLIESNEQMNFALFQSVKIGQLANEIGRQQKKQTRLLTNALINFQNKLVGLNNAFVMGIDLFVRDLRMFKDIFVSFGTRMLQLMRPGTGFGSPASFLERAQATTKKVDLEQRLQKEYFNKALLQNLRMQRGVRRHGSIGAGGQVQELGTQFIGGLVDRVEPLVRNLNDDKTKKGAEKMSGVMKLMQSPKMMLIAMAVEMLMDLIGPLFMLIEPFKPFITILSGVLKAFFGTLSKGIFEALMPFYKWMVTMVGSVQDGTESIVLFLQEGWAGWQDYWTKYYVAQNKFWFDSEYGWTEYYADMGLAWEEYFADYNAAWDKHLETWLSTWDEYAEGWYTAWDDYASDYGEAWNTFYENSINWWTNWWNDILGIGDDGSDSPGGAGGTGVEWIDDTIDDVVDWWEDLWGGGTPTIGIPLMASGGMVKASSGGTIIRAGEGGEDEFITPRSKMGNNKSMKVFARKQDETNELLRKLIKAVS